MQRDTTEAERERLTDAAQSSSQDPEAGLQARMASHTGTVQVKAVVGDWYRGGN